MSNRKNPADPSALEYALEELENLSAKIIAGLNNALEAPEVALPSQVTQQILLRGQLLHEANQIAQGTATELNPQEQQALKKKLLQLQALHSDMGHLLNQHHTMLKSAMQENTHTHVGVKAYEKTQIDAVLEPYLNDA
jgi:hypothetical protein